MELQKFVTTLLIFSIALLSINDCSIASAASVDYDTQISKVKADVQKKAGKNVIIQLKDGSKVKGQIGTLRDDSFDLRRENGIVSAIPYADVKEMKGRGLPKGAKIGIIVGAGVAIFAIIAVHSVRNIKFGDGNFLEGL